MGVSRNKNSVICAALLGGAVAFAFPPPSCADDLLSLPLESLLLVEYEVSSASKFTQTTSRAPTSVQVIDAEAIRRYGWRNLGELLNSLPGMLMGSDRAYDFIGVRGFQMARDFNHSFLLAIDGQRINDPIYEQAMVGDEFPLDLSLIERVEFVSGPGSSIYGSNALFGVINVITKRSAKVESGAALTVASDGWRMANGRISTQLDEGAALTLAATAGDKAGQDVAYAAPPGYLLLGNGAMLTSGVATGLDKTRLARLFARWENDDTDLTLTHGTRIHHPSSPVYGAVFNDPALRLEDASSRLSLSGHRSIIPDLEFKGHLAYNRMSYTGDYPYLDPVVGYYVNHDQTEARWWSGEGYLVYSGFSGHKLVGGIEILQEMQARQQSVDTLAATGAPPLNINTPSRSQGVYFQDEWSVADNWLVNLGLRYDRHNPGYDRASPRLAVVWQPQPGSSLKLMDGRAFRNPSDYEAFYRSGWAWLANPALLPESIHTTQLVGEQRLGSDTQFSATLFRYDVQNTINHLMLPGGVMQHQNMGSMAARGMELLLTRRGAIGWQWDAALAMQQVTDSMGQRADNSPIWSGRLKGSHDLPGNWIFSAESHVTGSRSFMWADGATRLLPTTPLLNLVLTLPKNGLSGQFRLTNVFNHRYFMPASITTSAPLIPGASRTLWLGVSYAY